MADRTPTTLYRLFDADDRLLYVGIAGNPGRRFQQHASEKPWWGLVAHTTLEHFPDRQSAAVAELAAIAAERPAHNIVGVRRGITVSAPGPATTVVPPVSPVLGPYPADVHWKWEHLRSGREWIRTLELRWEVEGSALDADPREDDAEDLWRQWSRPFTEGVRGQLADILWMVVGPGVIEIGPFQAPPFSNRNFLKDFSWPTREDTGELLNWNRLPVSDLGWTKTHSDKGGFIQQVTGWKPSPLQPYVDVTVLARAAGRGN